MSASVAERLRGQADNLAVLAGHLPPRQMARTLLSDVDRALRALAEECEALAAEMRPWNDQDDEWGESKPPCKKWARRLAGEGK